MLETDRRPEQAKRSSGKYQFSAGTAFRLFRPTHD
jgi:hypothetical protein